MGYRDHRFFYDLILTFEIDGIKGKKDIVNFSSKCRKIISYFGLLSSVVVINFRN